MPSLRQIQYFLTVADLGGFTPAAAALYVAQSALSRQIGQLEDELGFRLFEREPRGVRLTPAGAVYRDRVASVPTMLVAAADEGAQLSRGEAGVLRLLHSSTIPVNSLMADLDRFMRDCPNARIDLDRASSEDQVSEVANGHADIGIVRLPVLRRDARVRFVELAAERLCVALPVDHRLAARRRTTVAQLKREPFVSAVHRERGGLARVVIDLCLKRGFVPTAARIVSPKTSMLNLVAAGRGIAIVPKRMASLGVDGVAFVRLSDDDAQSVCTLVLPVEPTALAEVFVRVVMAGRREG
ncbi:LysR family transcriptional regulator [Burkholderia cepacia]|uniref:LysR family transcriptional regulator n=1 Tax=Burkholderia cepacia TaxID=292 RepID=A0A0J6A8I1_BURCE|nr:LysR family transcriptional regulator [Burkholderia cepacia]KML62110.1 LysR family transcriptional regulator [Burkholderia cepacia]